MPRSRSPDRDKAMEMYLKASGDILLKDISASLGVSDTQVRKWKNQDQWDAQLKGNVTNPKSNVTKRRGGAPQGNQNATGHGAPSGNQNAKGNAGGPGGPARNKKALTTGEYETIWVDMLDDDERDLLKHIDTDPVRQSDDAIRLLALRERRMMARIKKLQDGLTENQRRVLQELKTKKDIITVHDERTGATKTVPHTRDELVVTEIEETQMRVIDDILNLEEALTRVQDKKLKAIDLKHRLDPPEDDGNGKSATVVVRRWSR